MKKTSTIKKAQMGAAVPAKSKPAKLGKFNPKTPSPKGSKGAVYEGYTLPEYTVKAPKAKTGTSLGMKSVKAGYDNNPGVTRADIISAATGKAKNGAKVASKKVVGKKPIKKAQDGGEAPLVEGMTLPEFTKTASRIVDKPKKAAKPQKNYTRDLIKRANKMNKNQPGYSRMNPRRYEDGGELKKMKTGGKCKYGC